VLGVVHTPRSVDDALSALRSGGRVIAGGTTVMGVVNTQALDFTELVSLRRAGLGGIQVTDGTAVVGATTTIAELGADEKLAFLRPVVETFAFVDRVGLPPKAPPEQKRPGWATRGCQSRL